MINKFGQKFGPKRGSRHRFPYEPRVIGGKLLMPVPNCRRSITTYSKRRSCKMSLRK
jgi:hypothetical protein